MLCCKCGLSITLAEPMYSTEPCHRCIAKDQPPMTATVLQCDREAAWPHRDQIAYKESDKEAWMRGTYDRSRIIQGFARHRHDSTREMAEALTKLIAIRPSNWDDTEDFEQWQAWLNAEKLLATLQGTDR